MRRYKIYIIFIGEQRGDVILVTGLNALFAGVWRREEGRNYLRVYCRSFLKIT